MISLQGKAFVFCYVVGVVGNVVIVFVVAAVVVKRPVPSPLFGY